MARKLCNYANASSETPKKGALYQRGQYYIIENNDRKGDRRRYSAYINDSMIGMGGSLARMKRFINQMYATFDFQTDVSESMETKTKSFARLAQMTLRTEMKPSKAKSAKKSTATKPPVLQSKKSDSVRATKPKTKKSKAEPKAPARPKARDLLTPAKAKEILDQFQSVKIGDHITYAEFTKKRVIAEYADLRNTRTLIKQLDKLIQNRKAGIIPNYGIRRVL
tara:strand:- start:360 stop:1028 length:669 start_codon:yes stop_codon:yes gene_type:complete